VGWEGAPYELLVAAMKAGLRNVALVNCEALIWTIGKQKPASGKRAPDRDEEVKLP
jgi:hypothetical protein